MPKAKQQRADTLEGALEQLEKTYGPGVIMPLDGDHLDIQAIPTGSIALDNALGVGGLPCGRVTEIYGPEGSGKTTVALGVIANAQRNGGVAAFIDAEHALSLDYAQALGVVTSSEQFKLAQPDSGEQGLEIADALAGKVDIIVIDSVAALVPQAEIDGLMGDAHVGLQARLMGQALRKLTPNLGDTCVVFINQLREKVGVFFGSPETTPGGKALKFYASVRLDVRKVETLKDGPAAVGSRVRVKAVKNKVAPPLREVEFNIIFGRGIDWADELVELGASWGLIKKSGNHYSIGPVMLGNGKAAARATLRGNPEQTAVLREKVLEAMAKGGIPVGDLPELPVAAGETAQP